MNCEKCNAKLSAGDISVFPEEKFEITYKVVCPLCEHVQSYKVYATGGQFIVVYNTGKEADRHES